MQSDTGITPQFQEHGQTSAQPANTYPVSPERTMPKKIFLCLSLVCILLLGASCNNLQNTFNSSGKSAPIELTIEQVSPGGSTGNYALRGQTSLPEGTQLSVFAVRYLQQPSDQFPDEKVTQFAILDREFITTQNQQWNTELNLWQTTPDGKLLENWQLPEYALDQPPTAEPTVTFFVTLDPANFTEEIKRQVNRGDRQTDNPILRFTPAGEGYLQASQVVSIALPTGQTSAPPAATAPENPWQGRNTLNPAAIAPNPTSELPFAEGDNLPLPQENAL
jgi:hypothetical protein